MSPSSRQRRRLQYLPRKTSPSRHASATIVRSSGETTRRDGRRSPAISPLKARSSKIHQRGASVCRVAREEEQPGDRLQRSAHTSYCPETSRRTMPVDMDMVYAIQFDPFLAAVAIEELFHRNRALMSILSRQQEDIERLEQTRRIRSSSSEQSTYTEAYALHRDPLLSSRETDQAKRPPEADAVPSRCWTSAGNDLPDASSHVPSARSML